MVDLFDRYSSRLSGRFPSIKIVLSILDQWEGSVIVETGCMRADGDWGAGMSTFIFGEYADQSLGRVHVYSVDMDPQNAKFAAFMCHSFPVTVTCQDSLLYLHNFDKPIDLLYLDSFDFPLNNDSDLLQKSQEHQLHEIQEAWPKLSPHAIILLDDVDFLSGGKSKLTERYLKDVALNIYRGQQSVWLKLED